MTTTVELGTCHSKQATPEIKALLESYGGRTFDGRPLFRMVWSEEFPAKYRRFWQRERWIIERYVDPEWAGAQDVYAYCDILDDQGEPIEPTGTYLRAVMDRVRNLRAQTLAEYLKANEIIEEERYQGIFNRVLDQIKDANRPFAHVPRTWLTGLETPLAE